MSFLEDDVDSIPQFPRKRLCNRGIDGFTDGFVDGIDEIVDIAAIDVTHGGNLEDFISEWAFSAIDDKITFSQGIAESVEIHVFWEAYGCDGI